MTFSYSPNRGKSSPPRKHAAHDAVFLRVTLLTTRFPENFDAETLPNVHWVTIFRAATPHVRMSVVGFEKKQLSTHHAVFRLTRRFVSHGVSCHTAQYSLYYFLVFFLAASQDSGVLMSALIKTQRRKERSDALFVSFRLKRRS